MQTPPVSPPPPDGSPPVIQAVFDFYRHLYIVGQKISKRDRFGIYLKIEVITLDLTDLLISAAFETRVRKDAPLRAARIKIEILKRLIRLANGLSIFNLKKYTELQSHLQEISKMTSGWIRYLEQRRAP